MRKTKLSTAVQTIFAASTKPLSVAEVSLQLQNQGFTPNKTTLYRMLERLCQENITQKLTLADGIAHYEKQSQQHGHFICTSCADVECLSDITPNITPSNIQKRCHGKSIFSIELSIKGLCSNCT